MALKLKRIWAGRYEALPWIICKTGPRFWTLFHVRDDGSREREVEIDNFPTFREAKAALEKETRDDQAQR